MKPLTQAFCLSACLIMAGCSKSDTVVPGIPLTTEGISTRTQIAAYLNKHKAGLLKAEFMSAKLSKSEGMTIVYNDTKKRPDAEFVYNDPRRAGSTSVTYAVGPNLTKDFGVSNKAVNQVIDRVMQTWSRLSWNNIKVKKLVNSCDMGYVSSQMGFGGNEISQADIQQVGFISGDFFDALTPGGSDFVLAVTFTFIYFDEDGIPTDIDNDGVNDVAFRETYYNDKFKWRINSSKDFDIESVVLHEVGHALGLSHFGKGIICNDGKLRFTPRAVMNAVYVSPLHEPKTDDVTFLRSVWRNWNH